MKTIRFMVVAGEPSGDAIAADLVRELSRACVAAESRPTRDLQPLTASFPPVFFGAGGREMSTAGVELLVDLTAHAVVGLAEAWRAYGKFKRFFDALLDEARRRCPDVIILVDFSGFNRRLARAIRRRVRAQEGTFSNWDPKIVYYISPQVWASRESRARQLARDVDLLLSIFPFEKDWYAQRVPELRVEYVGHPLLDRYRNRPRALPRAATTSAPFVLLLPGSRPGELNRHLPVMLGAVRRMKARGSYRFEMILPSETLEAQARPLLIGFSDLPVRVGGLAEALERADVAIASTGTVTMECAYFGVPTVAIYKTSWITYEVGKRVVRVKHLAMPNLLAGHTIYPELIQGEATPENIAREALELLTQGRRRAAIQADLEAVIASLGGPGASQRAAETIVSALDFRPALRAGLRTNFCTR